MPRLKRQLFSQLFNGPDFDTIGVCSVEGGEGGEGGGGGGGGEGGMSEEMKQGIAQAANSAVASFMKRGTFRQTVQEAAAAAVTEALPGIMPQLTESVVSAIRENQGGGDGGQGGQGGQGGLDAWKQSDEYQAMIKKQKDLENTIEEQKRKQKEKDDQAAKAQERSALERALRESGVPDRRVAPAAAYLYGELGVVGRDSEQSIVWRAQRDGYVDEIGVDAGVKEWLATDVGKEFLPPKDGRGSGARGGGAPRQRHDGEKMSKSDAMDVLGQALMGGVEGQ